MLTKHTHVSQFTPPPARASLPYDLARPSVASLHDLYGLATVHAVTPPGRERHNANAKRKRGARFFNDRAQS
jgi:hypothetical protein